MSSITSPVPRPVARSYRLWVEITKGNTRKTYSIRPLPPSADLLASLHLICKAQDSCYHVGLDVDGKCCCECPSGKRGERCKHVLALEAAGLLPVGLVELLNVAKDQVDALEHDLAVAKLANDDAAQDIRQLELEADQLRGEILALTTDLEQAQMDLALTRDHLDDARREAERYHLQEMARLAGKPYDQEPTAEPTPIPAPEPKKTRRSRKTKLAS